MANYTLEEKDSFTVLGLGTELKSDYTDYAGITKEKSDFWQAVKQDGRLDTLKSLATNDYIFAVNEAVNNKMMHYAGVMTEATLQCMLRIHKKFTTRGKIIIHPCLSQNKKTALLHQRVLLFFSLFLYGITTNYGKFF
ncbi:effector binding domain-containing protein [Robertmurraya andreesenii]|uniref:Integron-associated effector binding protein domain-containing protein n=1 Tax=Anoxybacillus andreesenii TaxID=1325932 RepID=A0ABT9VA17_9BACL|nr:effector binding domain-containing protein [Robertmurraya andreesenii]MDQ0157811.1 hypothetical protein [Robertmurraya andreesenii]